MEEGDDTNAHSTSVTGKADHMDPPSSAPNALKTKPADQGYEKHAKKRGDDDNNHDLEDHRGEAPKVFKKEAAKED